LCIIFEDHIIDGIGDEHGFAAICSKNTISKVKGQAFLLAWFLFKKNSKKIPQKLARVFFFFSSLCQQCIIQKKCELHLLFPA
jgi:hypothetical protein